MQAGLETSAASLEDEISADWSYLMFYAELKILWKDTQVEM